MGTTASTPTDLLLIPDPSSLTPDPYLLLACTLSIGG